jgi:hypothetical protein
MHEIKIHRGSTKEKKLIYSTHIYGACKGDHVKSQCSHKVKGECSERQLRLAINSRMFLGHFLFVIVHDHIAISVIILRLNLKGPLRKLGYDE